MPRVASVIKPASPRVMSVTRTRIPPAPASGPLPLKGFMGERMYTLPRIGIPIRMSPMIAGIVIAVPLLLFVCGECVCFAVVTG